MKVIQGSSFGQSEKAWLQNRKGESLGCERLAKDLLSLACESALTFAHHMSLHRHSTYSGRPIPSSRRQIWGALYVMRPLATPGQVNWWQ